MAFNLIIEGANCTGKTTSMKLLRKNFSDATMVEFHDYYYDHVKSQFGIDKLEEKEDWVNLTPSQRESTNIYLDKRFLASINFARNQEFNCVIFERLVLTRLVYSEILLDTDMSDRVDFFDGYLAKDNFILVLLSNSNEDELKNKILKKVEERNMSEGRKQFHLIDPVIAIQKVKLYKKYYDMFTKTEKHFVQTSGKGDSRKELLESELLNILKPAQNNTLGDNEY